MNIENRLPLALLLLRLSVFLVMFVWTVDKFVEPQHASKIMAEFYSLSGLGIAIIYLLAVMELAIILAFLLGFAKRWSYALVMLLHAIFDTVILSEILKPVPTSQSPLLCRDPHASSLLRPLLSPGRRCAVDR